MNTHGEQQDLDTGNGELGIRIRQLRLGRGLRMRDVADQAGCSESMISKIETGRAAPSLRVLHKVANALQTSISALFEPPRSTSIVRRAGERQLLALRPGDSGSRITLERLAPTHEGELLEVNIHIVEAGAASDGAISHQGEEVGYVLEGCLELTVNGERHYLQPGDSFLFSSMLEHHYYNPGHVTARVLWINTPITF